MKLPKVISNFLQKRAIKGILKDRQKAIKLFDTVAAVVKSKIPGKVDDIVLDYVRKLIVDKKPIDIICLIEDLEAARTDKRK